ncbi:MAG: Kelch repeat-containing protein [Chitinophagaceae bacterium]
MHAKNHFTILPGVLALLVSYQTSLSQEIHLPVAVTNHSTVILRKDGADFLYTFYGIDSSKTWSGVHKKIMRVNLQTGKSAIIGEMPDSMGRLASSASVINNKAYIVGGYAVYADGKERSSRQLFIFDPVSETCTKGADILIAIDDHGQAVADNKLLYVISGWNDSLNVHSVQVYNPMTNTWQLATQLPNEPSAAVFGGAGTIVGDTIYFLGGAIFSKNYPPSRQFYKGVIDKNDPLKILWKNAGTYPGEFRYRSISFENNGKIFFWGGSNQTYNYNGISYQQKKPVEPNKTVLIYDIKKGSFRTKPVGDALMDLRNITKSSNNKWYLAGGMSKKQKPSNKVIELKVD